MDALLLPLHMGALHPYEKALTLALAFGPFLLLAVVVWLRRRADDREQREQDRQDRGQRER